MHTFMSSEENVLILINYQGQKVHFIVWSPMRPQTLYYQLCVYTYIS